MNQVPELRISADRYFSGDRRAALAPRSVGAVASGAALHKMLLAALLVGERSKSKDQRENGGQE